MNRARAKAIALARRRPDPLPWLPWLLLATLLVAASAFAQSPQTGQSTAPGAGTPLQSPTAPMPGQSTAPGPAQPDTPGGNTRNGVASPVPNRDPGIVQAVPTPATGMPVIRPPGTPGGNPNVVPK